MNSRELLLLRHAKSDWNTGADSDYGRPLSKRGLRDAPRVGHWLDRQGLRPDLIIASLATRAGETARAVCKGLGIEGVPIHWEERVYEASLQTLLTVLGECPEQAPRVLLVGHNPGLERLLAYLCGPDIEASPDGKVLPTATLAHMGLPWDWRTLQPGSGRLIALTRPAAMDA
uniref:Phosphohistidine phosphatase n=1 Tax=Candidatus Kentrum eta TaxID=2126337 RepID=A0A450V0I4_9GAMM|nr:MAG: phosphohistidine phosphatase [Candidatus Kentron sp. H]VFJ91685.1 MAG: phosphohistidine phosphatase [Candidatus Kentron sp. H]VFJ98318.1 MAG: phosphohistidine phosphatase [Candidatus Kentron sp. H]